MNENGQDLSPEEIEQQAKQQEISQAAQDFGQHLADLIVANKDTLPLAYMAKNLLSTSVDLIMNQAAIQTQFVVQEMLAPLFQQKEADPSRIIIP